jgi:hypothetical protein
MKGVDFSHEDAHMVSTDCSVKGLLRLTREKGEPNLL